MSWQLSLSRGYTKSWDHPTNPLSRNSVRFSTKETLKTKQAIKPRFKPSVAHGTGITLAMC
jgi:hypothetical protein